MASLAAGLLIALLAGAAFAQEAPAPQRGPGANPAQREQATHQFLGLGVVPETRAGRRFRDELGRLNQRLAGDANDFTVIMAGRPLMTTD